MELLDKEKVVAEIKKRIKEIDEIGTYLSPKGVLTNLLCYLDTLEVKEVDLEKATMNYLLHEHVSSLNVVLHHADLKLEVQYHKDIEDAYKAGFELGLKIRKGE